MSLLLAAMMSIHICLGMIDDGFVGQEEDIGRAAAGGFIAPLMNKDWDTIWDTTTARSRGGAGGLMEPQTEGGPHPSMRGPLMDPHGATYMEPHTHHKPKEDHTHHFTATSM